MSILPTNHQPTLESDGIYFYLIVKKQDNTIAVDKNIRITMMKKIRPRNSLWDVKNMSLIIKIKLFNFYEWYSILCTLYRLVRFFHTKFKLWVLNLLEMLWMLLCAVGKIIKYPSWFFSFFFGFFVDYQCIYRSKLDDFIFKTSTYNFYNSSLWFALNF